MSESGSGSGSKPERQPCHSIVFRDVSEAFPVDDALRSLQAELRQIQSRTETDVIISALLRAGELECSFADAQDCRESLSTQVCDLLADALVSPERAGVLAADAQALAVRTGRHGELRVSRPEGFCFYALHPLDYAQLAKELPLPDVKEIIVIGIRSIGTTLSAVVAAALRKRRGDAPTLSPKNQAIKVGHPQQKQIAISRFTVRPQGHPYDRTCEFSAAHAEMIGRAREHDPFFLVVDEGPGLSGSSFLSVGEALMRQGVEAQRIKFLCSHDVEAAKLAAPHAEGRWQRFRAYVAHRKHDRPIDDAINFGGGTWRKRVFPAGEDWPAVWTQLSTPKYLSHDGREMSKYEGLGRYGADVRARTTALADGGFTVQSSPVADGFSRYPWINGRVMAAEDASQEVLERIAEYLAFRLRNFQVGAKRVQLQKQEEMARFNFAQACGRDVNVDVRLRLKNPVIADARMMPYEWLQPENGGALLKLDCAAHGDNHFFPGPVDIAWDVAGTIIEWRLAAPEKEYLLERYQYLTGDNVRERLTAYLLAYAAFQSGFARMAGWATAGSEMEETARFTGEVQRYRMEMEEAEELLQSHSSGPAVMNKIPLSRRSPQPVLLT